MKRKIPEALSDSFVSLVALSTLGFLVACYALMALLFAARSVRRKGRDGWQNEFRKTWKAKRRTIRSTWYSDWASSID